MPKDRDHSSTNNDGELKEVSILIKLAGDQIAVEKACRLIDSYVLDRWHEAPGLIPQTHDADD
jgi:hypothetical protein